MVTLLAVDGLETTSQAFRARLVGLAQALGLDADALAAVMSFESAKTFSPSIRNPSSGAVGLIQFLPSTANKLGTTADALAHMSATEQLDYVAEYFKRVGPSRIVTPLDHYLAVFSPAFIGKGPEAEMYVDPSDGYRQNQGFDVNDDGRITVGEVGAMYMGVIHRAEGRPRLEVAAVSSSPSSPSSPTKRRGAVGAGVVVVVAGLVWAWARGWFG